MISDRWKNDRQQVQDLVEAVRQMCLYCSCYSSDEVENCWSNECPLYPYRLDSTSRRRVNSPVAETSQKKHAKTLGKTGVKNDSEIITPKTYPSNPPKTC